MGSTPVKEAIVKDMIISGNVEVNAGSVNMNSNPINNMMHEKRATDNAAAEGASYFSSTKQTLVVGTQNGNKYLGIGDMLKSVYDSDSDGVLNVGAIPPVNSLNLTANISMGGYTLVGLPDATAETQPVTLRQLNQLRDKSNQKTSCKCAYLTNITLSGAAPATDGVTPLNGDRIIAAGQTQAWQNGPYIVNTAGAWTRSTDGDTWNELVSARFPIEQGTIYGDTDFCCTIDVGGTLGTNSIDFVVDPGAKNMQFPAQSGLERVGTSFRTVPDNVYITVSAANKITMVNPTAYVRHYDAVTNSSAVTARTVFTIPNPSGSVQAIVKTKKVSNGQPVSHWYLPNASTIEIYFTIDIAANEYSFEVIG